jgi:prepilin peptidase CpaA
LAAVCDLRSREVPNWISLSLLSWAIVGTTFSLIEINWFGLVAGLMLAGALGAGLFALGAFGGGDVKLIAALGAVLGPGGLIYMLFWTALAGGALALVAAARRQREFAYVPAIALGLAFYALSSWLDLLNPS